MLQGKQSIRNWFLLSIILSMVIQVIGIISQDPLRVRDGIEYLSISRNIYEGNGFAVDANLFEDFKPHHEEKPTRMRQPLYPLFLVVFYWFLGENIIIVQICQIVLNLLSFFLIYRIMFNAFQDKLWPGTLVIVGVYWPVWIWSNAFLTESLFIFLLMLSMYVLQKAIQDRDNMKLFVFTGVLFGLGFLTKVSSLLICVLSFLPILFALGFKKATVRWGLLFLVFLITLSPWFIRNAVSLGDYTPMESNGGYGFWTTSVREEEEPHKKDSDIFRSIVQDDPYNGREANDRFKEVAIENIKKDPVAWFLRSVKRLVKSLTIFPGGWLYNQNFYLFWFLRIIQIMMWFIVAFFIVVKYDLKKISYFLFPVIAVVGPIFAHQFLSRYYVPVMPFVLVLMGQGLHELISRLRFTKGT